MRLAGLLVLSLLLASCEGEPPVPEKPTWVDDIKPIYQGNCFGCHGPGASRDFEQFRWDVYGFDTDPKYAELGFPKNSFLSGSDMAHTKLTLLVYLGTTATNVRMPPPPALPLSARDVATIQKWLDTGQAHGEHHPNHKPRIAWFAKPLFEVVDDDHDQVLGQLDCGGKTVQIDHTGGWKLPDGTSPPCTARLYDGFEEGGGTLE
jgi:hypothetical protein